MAGSGSKLQAGHVLDGRYHLETVIGEGGMGTVFAARHLELGGIVAVKVLSGASTEEHIERFLREARLASKIKNEHVVKVLDVARGEGETPPYIVMELLDGGDIADLIRAFGKVPIPDACSYVLQACEALAEAHVLGIVHRDLKSSNLHISHRSDGSPLVKVLDFGISKMHDDEADGALTTTSSVFGSPAYMSPEQIRSAKHVDHRTDVWAMAVVLYEMLTSELPFLGDNAHAMLASISADKHIPVAHFLPTVPPGLEAAMGNALKKNRDQRTPSVAAFAEAIAPYALESSAASLVAIRAILARGPQWNDQSSKRPAPSMQPPSMPLADAVAATVHADPPMMETPRHAAVSRTDRDAVLSTQRMSPLLVAIVTGAIVAAVVGIGAALFVIRVQTQPTPTIVIQQTPPIAIEPPPVSAEPPLVLSAPTVTAAVSVTTTRTMPPIPRGRIRPLPPPAAPAPKPNASIDLSQRN